MDIDSFKSDFRRAVAAPKPISTTAIERTVNNDIENNVRGGISNIMM